MRRKAKLIISFIVMLSVCSWLAYRTGKISKLERPEEHPYTFTISSPDTTIVYREGDSIKIDSFIKSLDRKPTAYEDSMYKAYGLDKLDSEMNAAPH